MILQKFTIFIITYNDTQRPEVSVIIAGNLIPNTEAKLIV